MSANNNLVLQAEPGAGKSTALPLSLLKAKWLKGKKILMLEPRRVAAKSIAHYLAKQLNEKVGQTIGYQIKNDKKTSKNTILEVVTEGVLTRRLQHDPEISDIGLIIFDEFHERSIHADLSLLLSLEIQQSIREDLRLLVMSATIDTTKISQYMHGTTVMDCPGRVFPVSIEYTKLSKDIPLVNKVITVLRNVLNDHSNIDEHSNKDILIFLPGQSDIKKCIAESKKHLSLNEKRLFLPLYGGLSLTEQEQVLTPNNQGKQRIIFATNIAETSLTINGITCVIDSGLEKTVIYDPFSGMTRLQTSSISKASAEQRKGRAGRTQSGTCIRLWNEQKQKSLREYQGEEILSADLTSTVLELCLWGAGNYREINWLTPPPKTHYISAIETLLSLGLIDFENNITALGKKAACIGAHPRLATMILKAEDSTELSIACELAALISDRDIFPHNNGSDITARLLALQEYKIDKKSALKNFPLIRSAVEQLQMTSMSLIKSSKNNIKINNVISTVSLLQLQNSIGKLLLHAYPERLAKRRSTICGRYKLANSRGAILANEDPLFGSDWLIIADCDAQKKEGRIFSAVQLTEQLTLDLIDNYLVQEKQFTFNQSKQKITGRNIVKYKAIEITSTAISNIPPDAFQKCLTEIFKNKGLEILNWTTRCEKLLVRAQWLSEHVESFPKLSQQILLKTIDQWLLPYLSKVNSISALKKINIYPLFLAVLTWDEQQLLEKEAPTHYKMPSNKQVLIVYDKQKSPTVSIQLQELFGEINSPKIASGKIPLRFELLSPAQRPIQTTSDLKNFWNTSYFDVAKEMRGKYPKHRWPDSPLLEKPGKSIKIVR